MTLLEQGIAKGLIAFDEENKRITYVHQGKSRNYQNPEEKVQADAFLQLVLVKEYPVETIRLFHPVQMGSETKEADIVVFTDDKLKTPYLVVECKKADISNREFGGAINQAFSYASSLLAKYIWVTNGEREAFFEFDKTQPLAQLQEPDIPAYGKTDIPPFRFVKGGKHAKYPDYKFEDIKIVTQEKLSSAFKKAHDALWGGGQLNPSEAFDELNKLIFCKIWDEKNTKIREPYKFQQFKKEPNAELAKRIKEIYAEGQKVDKEVFKDDIRLDDDKMHTIVGYLQHIYINKTDLDAKGRAFEEFLTGYFRGNFGQYFTPRPVVEFIVDILPITHNALVLDTSCGSGGFLLYALNKVREQASDFHEKGTVEHHKHWHSFAENNLFGIEINDQIARTAKMNMIIHDDGHTNVIAYDGLESIDKMRQHAHDNGSRNAQRFATDTFDFIITNPPFGSAIKLAEKAYLSNYKFGMKEFSWVERAVKARVPSPRDNQASEILFLERCHEFLKPLGFIAVVVPDGILTNSSAQHVRDSLALKYRLVAVVSLPQTAFTATGAGVKSSVLVLQKHPDTITKHIENLQESLQDTLIIETDFKKKLDKIEQDKKQEIKEKLQTIAAANTVLSKKDIENSEDYKTWKAERNAYYTDLTNTLKENLEDQYTERLPAALGKHANYPILMAIAEEIGYDATGKTTNRNDLAPIATEVKRFIQAIQNGTDGFFA